MLPLSLCLLEESAMHRNTFADPGHGFLDDDVNQLFLCDYTSTSRVKGPLPGFVNEVKVIFTDPLNGLLLPKKEFHMSDSGTTREIRINPIVPSESVLVTTARGMRPRDAEDRVVRDKRSHVENCPFCPGNEDKTPPTIFAKPSEQDWSIRIVENLYPVLGDDREDDQRDRSADTDRCVGGLDVERTQQALRKPDHVQTDAEREPEEQCEPERAADRQTQAARHDVVRSARSDLLVGRDRRDRKPGSDRHDVGHHDDSQGGA